VREAEAGLQLHLYTASLPWEPRKNSLGTKEENLGNQGRVPWAPRNPNLRSWEYTLDTKARAKTNSHVP